MYIIVSSLFIGAANVSWPGLNAPLIEAGLSRRKTTTDKRTFDDRPRRPYKINPADRGWAGTTWPGRHAGSPQALNGGK